MATNYPSSLDSFTNPTATDTLDSATVPHAAQHDNINDAVTAIETALGANLVNVVLPARSISTTAPLTGGGDLSANRTLAVSAGSTSTAGVLQLTDSTSSTSTTTAATPNAVKSAYDLTFGGNGIVRQISGLYYRPSVQYGITSPTANSTGYLPMFFPTSVTLNRIACATSATFAGTASIRLAIYNNSDGRPTTVLLDAGTVSATAASTGYEITISQTVSAGLYWLAFNTVTAATTNSFQATSVSATSMTGGPMGQGQSGIGTGGIANGFSQSVNVTSGFSTAGTLATMTQSGGMVWVKIA